MRSLIIDNREALLIESVRCADIYKEASRRSIPPRPRLSKERGHFLDARPPLLKKEGSRKLDPTPQLIWTPLPFEGGVPSVRPSPARTSEAEWFPDLITIRLQRGRHRAERGVSRRVR